MSLRIKVIITVFSVLILSFGVYLGIIASNYTVPILMYHYINDQEPLKSRLGVSPKAFERQMRFLKEHRYNVLPFEELVNIVRERKKFPPRTVAITFDDGYLDNYTNAYPILKKYRIPATIFVVINRIGKHLGSDDYMSWEQIKELSDSGLITIGSHSMNHPNLSEAASDSKLKYEIFESKRILEEALRRKVDFFSYPFGGINTQARAVAASAGYRACVGTNFARGYSNNDLYALKRVRISENSNNLFIFWVESSGFYTYIKEQRDD